MKNFKFLMPVLAFVMAVGMAFANKANVQTAGWVKKDGIPYQLQNDPCDLENQVDCKVIFSDDPTTVLQVYLDSDLQDHKKGGTTIPYFIDE